MDTQDPRDVEAARAQAAALREQLAAVTRQTADVAEESARVHDQVAEVHEQLPAPLLDPADARRHADVDRAFAASEREQAAALDEPAG